MVEPEDTVDGTGDGTWKKPATVQAYATMARYVAAFETMLGAPFIIDIARCDTGTNEVRMKIAGLFGIENVQKGKRTGKLCQPPIGMLTETMRRYCQTHFGVFFRPVLTDSADDRIQVWVHCWLACGREDVLLSRGTGYRLAECIRVQVANE